MSEWISVKDEMPDCDQEVIVLIGYNIDKFFACLATFFADENEFFEYKDGTMVELYGVDYWSPMLDFPKNSGD